VKSDSSNKHAEFQDMINNELPKHHGKWHNTTAVGISASHSRGPRLSSWTGVWLS